MELIKMKERKSRKDRLVGRLTESDIMGKLHYTDSIAVFRRLGEKSIGGELYKAIIYTDIIYGSEYAIDTCRRLVAEPRKHGFVFPTRLGKMYLIKYFKRMHRFTEDSNYLKAIESYQDDLDFHVGDFAKQTIREMKED